jgi:hypothetical protein
VRDFFYFKKRDPATGAVGHSRSGDFMNDSEYARLHSLIPGLPPLGEVVGLGVVEQTNRLAERERDVTRIFLEPGRCLEREALHRFRPQESA